MPVPVRTLRQPQAFALTAVLTFHAAVLWGLWQHRLVGTHMKENTVFVHLVPAATPSRHEETQMPMRPKADAPAAAPPAAPMAAPPPRPAPHATSAPKDEAVLVASPTLPEPGSRMAEPALPGLTETTPSPAAALAHPPMGSATVSPPAPPVSTSSVAVNLGGELSLACPQRRAPLYPAISRRRGEEGTVTLRVELDESGSVVQASVHSSSGFPRLDEAALAAVWSWRCNPAMRHGEPARAVALQPFRFVLQGS